MGTTTDANKTGRVIPGTKLVNLQNYISRKAIVFGLTVTANEKPRGLNPVNIDAVEKQIKSIVLSNKKNHVFGNGNLFIKLGNSVGVTFNRVIVLLIIENFNSF
jgi:hypothetical protein